MQVRRLIADLLHAALLLELLAHPGVGVELLAGLRLQQQTDEGVAHQKTGGREAPERL